MIGLSQLIVVGLKLWVYKFLECVMFWRVQVEMCAMIWVDNSVKAVTQGDWYRGLSADPKSFTGTTGVHKPQQKLSGIQKVKPVALSWLKWEKKRVQEIQRALSFILLFWKGETWFYFDSFINQDSKFIDTWSELHKYQKPSHQSRTAGPEGAGFLCPCQASTQGELKPHSQLLNYATQFVLAIAALGVFLNAHATTPGSSFDRLFSLLKTAFLSLNNDTLWFLCNHCVIPDYRHVSSSPGMWKEPDTCPDGVVSSLIDLHWPTPQQQPVMSARSATRPGLKNMLNKFQMVELLEEDLNYLL